ncbi:MAG: STAS domain-containing protein [Ignavibacteria bacterium]|jgi:anti-sigma B factor antagonist|nr:STAS domain-containing protein [Ignavibacteria bacterium]
MAAKIKSTELQDKGIFILEPKGSFIGGDETDDLKFAIREIADKENLKLIIDLGDVIYLNSTALGVLISAHANYKKRNGEIKLTRLNKNLENLFVITKLSLIFDCFGTQQEAIESFTK